jgi:hypothetical protein
LTSLINFSLFVSSKDPFDDRLRKILRKHVTSAAEADDEIELDAENMALLAYSLYVKEVMQILFKASNQTTVDLKEKSEEILEGAVMTVSFAKKILKVSGRLQTSVSS